MSKLIIEFDQAVSEVELRPGVNTVGRASSCQIQLKDTSLSREHCRIRVGAAGCTLTDLGSMNGTMVNGQKVSEHLLRRGDVIKIGRTLLHFEAKRGATEKKQSRVRPVPAPVKDYAIWPPPTGRWVAPALVVLALLILAGAAFAVFKLRRGGEAAVDPRNLLKSNASFEDESIGWTIVRGSGSKLALDATAHDGAHALAIEKASGAADYVVEVAPATDLVPADGPIEFSAWVRAEDFTGMVAARLRYYAHEGGPVLLDRTSAPVPRSAAWVQVTTSLAPPEGATVARVSFLCIGGAGRVLLDEVKVYRASNAPAPTAVAGTYALAVTPSGQIAVSHQGRPLILNLNGRLESKLQGTAPQIFLTAVSIARRGNAEIVGGDIVAPVASARPRLEFELTEGEGQLRVGVRLDEATARLLDAFTLGFTIVGARVKSPRVPADGMLSSIEIESGGTTYVLSAPIPVQTTLAAVGEGVEVLQRWPGQGVAGGYVAAFSISPRGLEKDRQIDALKKEIEAAGKSDGVRADALAKLVGLLTDPKDSAQMADRLTAIQGDEAREFRRAARDVYEADLSGDADRMTRAADAAADFQLRYDSASFHQHVEDLSAAAVQMNSRVRDPLVPPRPDRLLARAKQYNEWGMDFLAREILTTIKERYPGSPEAREAETLLGALKP